MNTYPIQDEAGRTGKWKRWSYFVAVLLVLLSVVDYVIGVNSGALAAARQELQNSNALQRRIGPIHSVNLRWLWGYRETSQYGGDTAQLRLSIAGTQGKEDMIVDMQEIGGHWTVICTSTPI